MEVKVSLEEIARAVDGRLVGNAAIVLTGVNSLDKAGPEEVSFFADPRYKKQLEGTRAGAVIVAKETPIFQGAQVVVSHPGLAFARVASLFAPPVTRFPGRSERAFVHERSHVGRNVSIYPMVYVGEDTEIGDDVILFPGVFIGDRVKIGNGTVIYPNVTVLQDCVIGGRVIIHAGTVLGSDGFGYARDGSTPVKIPQTGIVQIDDEVEIGSNNCIDRAALGRTWIKRGVKTDNLVHIAHNVVIGENSMVLAQAAFSGSVEVGRGVIVGGQVAVADHVTIGDRVMIGGQSGIARSISSGEVVSGSPSMPHRLWLRIVGLIPRLPEFNERVRHLEHRIQDLEKRMQKE
jgi:UDP-3-O-[3-hydroxymyristoyl] glucosamine N-acyltransferase